MLRSYREKRVFTRTPEPPGAKRRRASGRAPRFVIHRHAARRLHFDVRLEHRGALVSFAVPKGPPVQPGERHLAVHVENHPLEYRTFTGRIPEGEYGAGKVEIWDEGTYEPEKGKSIDAGLAKGHLAVVFHGRKVRGLFDFIRTGKVGHNEKDWLLIRRADPPLRKPVTAFPDDFAPMLARETGEPFDHRDWGFEPKWDGYRAIAYVQADGSVRLLSRNQKNLAAKYPAVTEALSALNIDCVLDGEIVALNEKGIPDFQRLQHAVERGAIVQYRVFDLLYLSGHAITHLPQKERRNLLEAFLPASGTVAISEQTKGRGIAFFRRMKERGFEGMIAKNRESPYRPGERTGDWLKVKVHRQQEFVIGGFTAPQGGRTGFGALLLGYYLGEDLFYAGKVGTGFDDVLLSSLTKALTKLQRKTTPFTQNIPAELSVTWTQPRLVCVVRFREWTEDNVLRQPVFLGLRTDRDPRSVRRELPDAVPSAKTRMRSRAAISHPEKVFWPEEGYTKGELAEYYRAVAPFILPYLRDRPETLHRYPDGIAGPDFYQKNVEDAPAWVKTVDLPSPSRERMRAVLCQDLSTLLYLVNLGCIELHPWNERVGKSGRPDYLVMDLDPQDAPFTHVVEAARHIHTLLERLHVPCYCKTSGKRGLHLFVPLGARYSVDQSRQFAEILSRLIQQKLPQTTSVERSPARRKNLVYIDFLQNRRAQTLAAPYCVRPWPGATVSTPLRWSEVNAALSPAAFTITTIPQRLKKLGDLWKPVLGKGADMERALRLLR